MSGRPDAADVDAIRQQIQLLADEIAVLRAIPDGDPRRVMVDRVVGVKAATIRRLRVLLPGIPTTVLPESDGARLVADATAALLAALPDGVLVLAGAS